MFIVDLNNGDQQIGIGRGVFKEDKLQSEGGMKFLRLSKDYFREDEFGYVAFPDFMEGRLRPERFVESIFPSRQKLGTVTNGPRTVSRLNRAGILTVYDLMHADRQEIHNIIGNMHTGERIIALIHEKFRSLEVLPHSLFLNQVTKLAFSPVRLASVSPDAEDNIIDITDDLLNASNLTTLERDTLESYYNLNFQGNYWLGGGYIKIGEELGMNMSQARKTTSIALHKVKSAMKPEFEERLQQYSILHIVT